MSIEKFKLKQDGARDEMSEHNKILAGMFVRVGEEIAKILSVDEVEKMATVQFGKNGDIEAVSFDKLKTLKATESTVAAWENGDENTKDKLAA